MFFRIGLLVVSFVAVSSASSVLRQSLSSNISPGSPSPIAPPALTNVTLMIKKEGYPVEEYTVTTKDGYILDLIRIPYGIKKSPYEHTRPHIEIEALLNKDSQEDASNYEDYSKDSEENLRGVRKPILLMGDVTETAEDFIISGQYQAVAYLLADYGYDVYIGNTRGSFYGQKHNTLDAKKDSEFWNFGLHEIGVKDLPAIVDKVLEVSGKQSIQYVGHMFGSTAFFILTSEKPEYNDKIKSMVSLGPVAFLKESQNKMLKEISEYLHDEEWLRTNVGNLVFHPSNELKRPSLLECADLHKDDYRKDICVDNFFLLNGYNSHQLNRTTMMDLLYVKNSSPASAKQIVDLAVMLRTGRFGKISTDVENNSVHIRDYDLRKITTPVDVIAASKDRMLSRRNLRKLIESLGNFKSVDINNYENSLDLLHGNYVTYVVTPKLIRLLISK